MNKRYDHLHVSLEDAGEINNSSAMDFGVIHCWPFSTTAQIADESWGLLDPNKIAERHRQAGVIYREHLEKELTKNGFSIIEQHWPTKQITPLAQPPKLRLTIILDQALDTEYSEYLNGLSYDQINAVSAILATAEPNDIYYESKNEISFNIDPKSDFIRHFEELDPALKLTVMKVFSIGLQNKFHKNGITLEREEKGGNQ